jgi:RNA polymerase sigma-70 factor (ECF subfamily)
MMPPTVAGVDPERFVRLFVEGEREILRYILRLVPDIDDAREILQDTAVDLWRKFDRYDPAFAFAPWACGFAFRCVLKHREQKARRVKYLSIESLDLIAAERSERDGVLEERRRALERCLQQLGDDDRLMLEHRYSQQMSVAKIAGTTGRNTSALYKALERIRRRLFECVNRRLQRGYPR